MEETDRSSIEEVPVKRITADEEYELEVNGFRCPDEFVTFFTPLEFEEVRSPFKCMVYYHCNITVLVSW